MIETDWQEVTNLDSYAQWDGGAVVWDADGNLNGVTWDAVSDTTTWTEQT